jgi:hypothetical protein
MRFWRSGKTKTSNNYRDVLKPLHVLLKPKTYVEIGIRHGESFELASAAPHAIGVDPDPQLRHPLWPGAKVFPMTSDDFFARYDLRKELGGNALELGFIDGMHLFEFALRDFINLEKYASKSSTILLHDCYPIDAVTSSRDRTAGAWSGDVWKVIICLKKYRRDLELNTIDVRPTGLGVVRNLDPGSRVLESCFEKLCQEFIPQGFESLGDDKAHHLNRIDNDWNQIRSLFGAPARTAL